MEVFFAGGYVRQAARRTQQSGGAHTGMIYVRFLIFFCGGEGRGGLWSGLSNGPRAPLPPSSSPSPSLPEGNELQAEEEASYRSAPSLSDLHVQHIFCPAKWGWSFPDNQRFLNGIYVRYISKWYRGCSDFCFIPKYAVTNGCFRC